MTIETKYSLNEWVFVIELLPNDQLNREFYIHLGCVCGVKAYTSVNFDDIVVNYDVKLDMQSDDYVFRTEEEVFKTYAEALKYYNLYLIKEMRNGE